MVPLNVLEPEMVRAVLLRFTVRAPEPESLKLRIVWAALVKLTVPLAVRSVLPCSVPATFAGGGTLPLAPTVRLRLGTETLPPTEPAAFQFPLVTVRLPAIRPVPERLTAPPDMEGDAARVPPPASVPPLMVAVVVRMPE